MKRALVAIAIGFIFLTVALMPTSVGAHSAGIRCHSGLTAEEVKILKGLDYKNAWNNLITISGMGEKVAGTAEELSAQKYVFNRLSSLAVDKVVMEHFPVAEWKHYGTTVEIASNDYEDVQATAYGDSYSIWGYQDNSRYAFGNENEGKTLVAQVIDCGFGTAAEFDALGSLGGAIALIHRDDGIQGWPNPSVWEAAQYGASATVFYGYYAGADLPEGIKQDSVGGPLPAISISPISAEHIIDLMNAGPVTLKIDGRVDMISEKNAQSTNVLAYMYGTTRPNEYVVISGHIDCWWSGANDDSSSIAAMLELARLFSQARKAGTFVNERTLVFCSLGAEEQGGPQGTWYNWLVGSYEFVKAHPAIMKGLAVELNMDGVSFVSSSGEFAVENTWEVNGLVNKAISDLGMNDAVSFYNPVWSWTDAWSFAAKGGGSAIQMMTIDGFDPYYHTQYDNMAMQSHTTIDTVLKLHSLLAIRATHALVLPLEFQYTVDWAASYLETEKITLPDEVVNINHDLAALRALRAQAVAVNKYASSLTAHYLAAKNPCMKAAIWDKANALNRALIDARRIITPWTLGEGGIMGSWDVFLRTEQHASDLGYVNSAIDALANGQTNDALAALENVYTMQWGMWFSRPVYLQILHDMMDVYLYWGAAYDQQQKYVDVQDLYIGVNDGTMTDLDALTALETIKDTQLTPWYEADLHVMAWAWMRGAGILDHAVP